ncbi:hypothetical protein C8R45DRAFT_933803 [Mycena sanguinolenta]|nr:hypothetical protein C8R45DRAFT_933803 [Mycena sanguinolenta]
MPFRKQDKRHVGIVESGVMASLFSLNRGATLEERLSVESNPLRLHDPLQSNYGATDSPVALIVVMEFDSTFADSTSHAPAHLRIPPSSRRSSWRRAASTIHSEAPPSTNMSAESSGVPIVLESGKSLKPLEFGSTIVGIDECEDTGLKCSPMTDRLGTKRSVLSLLQFTVTPSLWRYGHEEPTMTRGSSVPSSLIPEEISTGLNGADSECQTVQSSILSGFRGYSSLRYNRRGPLFSNLELFD